MSSGHYQSNKNTVQQPGEVNSSPPRALYNQYPNSLAEVGSSEGQIKYDNNSENTQNHYFPPFGNPASVNPNAVTESQYEEPSWGLASCYSVASSCQGMVPTGALDAYPHPDTQGQTWRQLSSKNQWSLITQALTSSDLNFNNDDELIILGDNVDDGSDEDNDQPASSKRSSQRKRGQVRYVNGQLQQRDCSDDKFEPAVYHSDIRDELIFEASQGGRLKYPIRRKKGAQDNDITAYLVANHNWGDQRNRRPDLCFRFKKDNYTGPDYYVGTWKRNGLYLIDHDDRRMMKYPNLPVTISSEESGMFLEAWRREDPRVGIDDMMGRMPCRIKKKAGTVKLYGVSTINMRMNRFRVNACLQSWYPRLNTDALDCYMDFLLPKSCKDANCTRDFRDLSPAESLIAWNINKGCRKINNKNLTDAERLKRKEQVDNRIVKLVRQENRKGMPTKHVTREQLTEIYGEELVPPIKSGVYKSKRKTWDLTEEQSEGDDKSTPAPKRQKSKATVARESSLKRQPTEPAPRHAFAHAQVDFENNPAAPIVPPQPSGRIHGTNQTYVEGPAFPDLDSVDFPVFNDTFLANQAGPSIGNLSTWLPKTSDFMVTEVPSKLMAQTRAMPVANMGQGSYSANPSQGHDTSIHAQDNSTAQHKVTNGSLVAPPLIQQPVSPSPAASGSTPLSSARSSPHLEPMVSPTIISADQKALDVTRTHIKKLLGDDANVPTYDPNQNYVAQYLQLRDFFENEWVKKHGERLQTPILNGNPPEHYR